MLLAAVMIVVLQLVAGGQDEPATGILAVGEPAWPAGDAAVVSPPGKIAMTPQEWAGLLPKLQSRAEASPDDLTAQRRYALALYNVGKLDEAAALWRTVLKHKEDASARNNLGNTLRDMGRYQEAEEAYRRALEDDPSLATGYVNLADLLYRRGRADDGKALLASGLGKVSEGARPYLEEAYKALTGEDPPAA